MTHTTQVVGACGERIAAGYLCSRGLRLIERNWRTPHGEIDIIARDGPDLVFCEVKTRRSTRFGVPIEAIVPAKVRRMRRLAALWLASAQVRPREVRFDVVSVIRPPSGAPRVEHLRGAF
jgi:putative endonuclease